MPSAVCHQMKIMPDFNITDFKNNQSLKLQLFQKVWYILFKGDIAQETKPKP